jgi:hypothetical protein
MIRPNSFQFDEVRKLTFFVKYWPFILCKFYNFLNYLIVMFIDECNVYGFVRNDKFLGVECWWLMMLSHCRNIAPIVASSSCYHRIQMNVCY